MNNSVVAKKTFKNAKRKGYSFNTPVAQAWIP